MVGRCERLTRAVLVVLTAGLMPCMVWAQGQWVSLGLDKHRVNCLFLDDAGRLLAGADDGLYLRYDTAWLKLTDNGLPVTALARAGVGRLLAAIGNGGSRSDGVYLAEDILDGPPFYGVRVIEWVRGPTALAIAPLEGGPQPAAMVFVGAGSSVYSGRLKGDTLKLTEMVLPPHCFGVEQPACRALHVLSADGRCYAGGYDGSPLPGPGSLIVEHGADSMHMFRPRTNVSAVTEVSPQPVRQPLLAAGTTDEGVFLFRDSAGSALHLPGPEREPIVHLDPVPAGAAAEEGLLYAAVPGGVYRQCLSTQDCIWTELGDLPAAPTFVLHPRAESPLYAASDNGVYVYHDVLRAGHGPAAGGRRTVEPWRAGAVFYDTMGRRVSNLPAVSCSARGLYLAGGTNGLGACRTLTVVTR